MTLDWIQLAIFFGGFIAGLVDTVAGGGGLLTVPLLIHAGLSPALAMGTDKLQAGFGEAAASIKLFKTKALNLRRLIPYIPFTFFGSLFGSILMLQIPSEIFAKALPFFMLALLILSFFKDAWVGKVRDQAHNKAPLILGSSIGFYNGFFGPGTGAFWTTGLMYWAGLNVKEATIYGKPLNFLGNIVSITFFMATGNVNYVLALVMGAGCIFGAWVGAKLLLASAERLILILFRLSVVVMTVSMFMRAYF